MMKGRRTSYGNGTGNTSATRPPRRIPAGRGRVVRGRLPRRRLRNAGCRNRRV